ncbi:MAG: IS1634 family transposase, partial [Gammaproteobacteria bacterium]|nr:IS1634 family transposase [Gammaproteobacteria bacterium]
MGLFLRCHRRHKNGKDHAYWSVVENHRSVAGKVVQRQVLYLGELTQAQQTAWQRLSEQIEPSPPAAPALPGFLTSPSTPAAPLPKVDFSRFSLHHPRQWGACWVADRMWRDLQMEEFWQPRLRLSREGTAWRQVLQTLVTYRLIDPGSEFRLHRQWLPSSAMADLLGAEESLVSKDNLYRCLDKLLEHRDALFAHLRSRWEDLFGVTFDILLYDLTSTYFESDPPFPEGDKRRFGYSRDHRPDCVQVVIALVITPEGFPMAYEVMAGNTQDKA